MGAMSLHPVLCIFAFLLYSCLIGVAVAFTNTHKYGYSSRMQQLSMAGGRFSNEIVVVGEVGGVTEIIVSSLGRMCPSTTLSVVLNGRPGKIQNINPAQSKIYSDESVLESDKLSLEDKIVVLVYEEEEAIRGQDTPRSKSEEMIEKVAKLIKSRGEDAMPASVVVATSVGSLEETKVDGPAAILSVFQKGTIRQSVAAIKAVSEGLPVSLLTYGSLLDNPAVPFLSPPLLEPKLVGFVSSQCTHFPLHRTGLHCTVM